MRYLYLVMSLFLSTALFAQGKVPAPPPPSVAQSATEKQDTKKDDEAKKDDDSATKDTTPPTTDNKPSGNAPSAPSMGGIAGAASSAGNSGSTSAPSENKKPTAPSNNSGSTSKPTAPATNDSSATKPTDPPPSSSDSTSKPTAPAGDTGSTTVPPTNTPGNTSKPTAPPANNPGTVTPTPQPPPPSTPVNGGTTTAPVPSGSNSKPTAPTTVPQPGGTGISDAAEHKGGVETPTEKIADAAKDAGEGGWERDHHHHPRDRRDPYYDANPPVIIIYPETDPYPRYPGPDYPGPGVPLPRPRIPAHGTTYETLYESEPEQREYHPLLVAGVGNGGEFDATSVSLEWLARPNEQGRTAVRYGIGLTAIFAGTDGPDDLIPSPPPITSPYEIAGKYFDTTYGFYGVVAAEIAPRLWLRGLLGAAQRPEHVVARSEVTGWYYELDTRHPITLLLGGGLSYRGVTLNYDTARGVSVGYEIVL